MPDSLNCPQDASAVQRALGLNVRRLRTARGLTHAALAEATKLSVRYIVRVEAGRANPHVTTLGAIADVLGVDAQCLLADGSDR